MLTIFVLVLIFSPSCTTQPIFGSPFPIILEKLDFGLLLYQNIKPSVRVLDYTFNDNDALDAMLVDLSETKRAGSSIVKMESNVIYLLTMKGLEDKLRDSEDCNNRTGFVKDLESDYLIDASNHTTKSVATFLFSNMVLTKLPCILPQQPFLFVLTKEDNITDAWILSEFQLFSQVFIPLVKVSNDSINLIHDNIPTIDRRSNFNGQPVKMVVDDFLGILFKFESPDKTGFTGFYGEQLTIYSSHFNFTPIFQEEKALDFGSQVNGSWTGRIGMLIENSIDVGNS